MIKKTIAGLTALLLAGCVTYYPYPYAVESTVSSTGETVVYAEEPDDYDYYDSSVDSSVYYPWTSVDYFYFGNHYYRPAVTFSLSYGIYGGGPWYGAYYGPYYYPSYWSFGYSPYYSYPYFGAAYAWGAWNYWYAPNWHHNYYGHGYGHGHGNGHGYDNGDGYGYGHKGGYRDGHNGGRVGDYGRGRSNRSGNYGNNSGDQGYAGDPRDRTGQDRQGRNERPGSAQDRNREIGTVNRNRSGQQQTRRQVGVPSSGSSPDRGIVVDNRNDNKLKPNRTGPVQRQPINGSVTSRGTYGGVQRNANDQVRTQPQPSRPVPMPAQRSGQAQSDQVVVQNRQPMQVARPMNAPQAAPPRSQSDNNSPRSNDRQEPRERSDSDDGDGGRHQRDRD